MFRIRRLYLSALACLMACNPPDVFDRETDANPIDCSFDGDLSAGVQGKLAASPIPPEVAEGTPIWVEVVLSRLDALQTSRCKVIWNKEIRWTPGPGSGTVQPSSSFTSSRSESGGGGTVLQEGSAQTTWILPSDPRVTATLTAEVVNSIPLRQVVFTTFTTPTAPPAIRLSGVTTFNATQGGANPASQLITITNSGGGTLSGLSLGSIVYTPVVAGWLQPLTLSGTTASPSVQLTLQPVTESLAAGTYTARVPVQSAVASNSPQNLVVAFIVAAPAASFALSLTQSALAIAQGASTPTTTVNIARTNFPGDVTLSVLNLPAGVTASFAPANPNAGNSSVLTLTVPLATPVGVYNTLAVQGVGTAGTVTTPLTLTVTAAPTSFSLSLTQPALSIAQGAATPTTTVTIARTNFTGNVALSVLNLPAGVTASFAPANPISGNSSVLTLTVPLATPIGVYNTLAVQGVGTAGTVTTPLTLTVTAAPAPAPLTLAILAGNGQCAGGEQHGGDSPCGHSPQRLGARRGGGHGYLAGGAGNRGVHAHLDH